MRESDYLEDEKFIQRLKGMRTLDHFEDEDLKGLLRLSKIRKYQPGELILEEGYYDCWIYFLVSGKVRVSKNGEDIGTLRRTGDVFGEMSVIDASPRSASIYAVDETVCLATDSSYIDRLSGHERTAFCSILYRLFAEILADRLRLANEELVRIKEENKRLKETFLVEADTDSWTETDLLS